MALTTVHFRANPHSRRRSRPASRGRARGSGRIRQRRKLRRNGRGVWILEAYKRGKATNKFLHARGWKAGEARARRFKTQKLAQLAALTAIKKMPRDTDIKIRRA